jgi:hypothetical protein
MLLSLELMLPELMVFVWSVFSFFLPAEETVSTVGEFALTAWCIWLLDGGAGESESISDFWESTFVSLPHCAGSTNWQPCESSDFDILFPVRRCTCKTKLNHRSEI